MPRLRREKHLLTFAIASMLEPRYAALPTKDGIIQMVLTNLRNRPLSAANIESMSESMLSLYHSLVTSSKDFPVIRCDRAFISSLIATPFPRIMPGQKENSQPTYYTFQPAGMFVSSQGSAPTNILMPVHPETAELGALRADRRNCVRDIKIDGYAVNRVISSVYSSDCSEVTNCWRLTDYSADGKTLMSVLCQFNHKTTEFLKTVRERRKRKATEDNSSSSSSSLSPPRKRLRL